MMMMNPIWVFISLVLAAASNYAVSATGGVFEVQHKLAGQEHSLIALKDHDLRRHGRFLYSVDFPLGGDFETGLYYAKLKIGSPPKDYYLQVDTGSDISLVNCKECDSCPEKSDLGVKLTFYDPSTSITSQKIDCEHDFCSSYNNGSVSDGCVSGQHCEYAWQTADGQGVFEGYFVKDIIQYSRVTGDLQTAPSNSSVVFGLDTNFPAITLIFEGAVQLVVYPHDYLIPHDGGYCIGWQDSKALLEDYADIVTLGDFVFANKLVVYDIENMNIGWKEYNCSSTIKVQDEMTKAIYDVQAHHLSSTPKRSLVHRLLLLCTIIIALSKLFTEI